MSSLVRHSVDWAGDMVRSPHGDWVHARDVESMQDELEAAKATIARLEGEVAEARNLEPVTELVGRHYRLFGFVNPDDARAFNSGKKDRIRVFKKRTEVFAMPVMNDRGPNHYQKPPPGTTVKVFGGDAMVVTHHPDGLIVEVSGIEFLTTKWSWRR